MPSTNRGRKKFPGRGVIKQETVLSDFAYRGPKGYRIQEYADRKNIHHTLIRSVVYYLVEHNYLLECDYSQAQIQELGFQGRVPKYYTINPNRMTIEERTNIIEARNAETRLKERIAETINRIPITQVPNKLSILSDNNQYIYTHNLGDDTCGSKPGNYQTFLFDYVDGRRDEDGGWEQINWYLNHCNLPVHTIVDRYVRFPYYAIARLVILSAQYQDVAGGREPTAEAVILAKKKLMTGLNEIIEESNKLKDDITSLLEPIDKLMHTDEFISPVDADFPARISYVVNTLRQENYAPLHTNNLDVLTLKLKLLYGFSMFEPNATERQKELNIQVNQFDQFMKAISSVGSSADFTSFFKQFNNNEDS